MKINNITKICDYLEGENITLIDIGARYGVHDRWRHIGNSLNAYAFEPDVDECQRINQSADELPYKLQCMPYALGSANRDNATLYLCKDLGCSSLYQPNLSFVNEFYFGPSMEVVNTVDVTVTKLEDVCNMHNIIPDVIKIDTQGYELEILRGSESILKTVKLVELEVEFNEQYIDQPLFSDVDKYMRNKGFLLLGFRRSYWRRRVEEGDLKTPFGGQIMHGDAIYYNNALLNESISKIDLIKFCIIFSSYQQDDFVAHLLSLPHKALNSIAEHERLSIARMLQNKHGWFTVVLSNFLDLIRKKLWLPHTNLRRMIDRLQSKNAKDWHDHDFF